MKADTATNVTRTDKRTINCCINLSCNTFETYYKVITPIDAIRDETVVQRFWWVGVISSPGDLNGYLNL